LLKGNKFPLGVEEGVVYCKFITGYPESGSKAEASHKTPEPVVVKSVGLKDELSANLTLNIPVKFEEYAV
jgi:hypothetical protein